jgi:GGDEF domain-containing protein
VELEFAAGQGIAPILLEAAPLLQMSIRLGLKEAIAAPAVTCRVVEDQISAHQELVGIARRWGAPGWRRVRCTVMAVTEHAATEAAALATRIHKAISTPFDLAGQQVSVGAIIGMAIAPSDASALATIYRGQE